MNPIGDNYPASDRTIVIFGAGKIGRSFMGQLFGAAGYRITFIDIDPLIVSRLNEKGCYRVVIKSETDREIFVRNVNAISSNENNRVAEAVSNAAILAVSVGKNVLADVIPLIASGLMLRYEKYADRPLDIIIAENMRSASEFMKERLEACLPAGYPFENMVGLIETSIGKMVPIMTSADLEKDPLLLYAEPYNTLILDRQGFLCPVPEVDGLSPKNNIAAWVDRKSFIHNLGHATAAYIGYYRHPDSVYMYEILDDTEVFGFTKEVMVQAAEILREVHPEEFSKGEIEDHIDDLLLRFKNKALRDTIFRVGHDLPRKLRHDDRFAGAIDLAVKTGKPCDKILEAMSYALFFRGKDEEGNYFQPDIDFLTELSSNFEKTITEILRLSSRNKFPIRELKKKYSEKSRE